MRVDVADIRQPVLSVGLSSENGATAIMPGTQHGRLWMVGEHGNAAEIDGPSLVNKNWEVAPMERRNRVCSTRRFAFLTQLL